MVVVNEVKLVAETLFGGAWDLFVHTKVPGTDLSVASITLAVFLMGASIRVFSLISGFSMGGSSYGKAADIPKTVRRARQHISNKASIDG